MSVNEPWTHRQAVVNGVRLHYVEQGDGPLVVLLHGFPEFWYSWRHQIPALADAGFRVIAPDQRGYNTSEKPPGVRSYRIEALVDDVAALILQTGESRAVVVGHDWGGAVAWMVPMLRPEVVHKLIVLNAPHPRAFQREMRTVGQLLKSWYILFFQLPFLPEIALRLGKYRAIERQLRREPKRPRAFSDEDIAAYKEAIAQPGALTAAINYYRATFRRNPAEALRMLRQIDSPTLLIWGEDDPYLGIKLTEGLVEWVPDIRVERIANASHWVQVDAAERVNQLMIDFLGGT
ncbi:MAG: alpha/beta hydrolase [Chloroflexi bacterium]|nr:alpha/beta hydrolase [Chloroflexota bacterium]